MESEIVDEINVTIDTTTFELGNLTHEAEISDSQYLNLAIILAFIIVFGLIGNILVLVVLCRQKELVKENNIGSFQLLFCCLAIADLFYLILEGM